MRCQACGNLPVPNLHSRVAKLTLFVGKKNTEKISTAEYRRKIRVIQKTERKKIVNNQKSAQRNMSPFIGRKLIDFLDGKWVFGYFLMKWRLISSSNWINFFNKKYVHFLWSYFRFTNFFFPFSKLLTYPYFSLKLTVSYHPGPSSFTIKRYIGTTTEIRFHTMRRWRIVFLFCFSNMVNHW